MKPSDNVFPSSSRRLGAPMPPLPALPEMAIQDTSSGYRTPDPYNLTSNADNPEHNAASLASLLSHIEDRFGTWGNALRYLQYTNNENGNIPPSQRNMGAVPEWAARGKSADSEIPPYNDIVPSQRNNSADPLANARGNQDFDLRVSK